MQILITVPLEACSITAVRAFDSDEAFQHASATGMAEGMGIAIDRIEAVVAR